MSRILEKNTDEHTLIHKSIALRNKIMKLTNEYHEIIERYLMKKLEKENE